MSTPSPQQQSPGLKKRLARGVDQTLIRLIYLSPIALILVLALEATRENGQLFVAGMIAIAATWTLIDFYFR